MRHIRTFGLKDVFMLLRKKSKSDKRHQKGHELRRSYIFKRTKKGSRPVPEWNRESNLGSSALSVKCGVASADPCIRRHTDRFPAQRSAAAVTRQIRSGMK